jgi:hypothetical protein
MAAFLLHPDAGVPRDAPEDRFASMSVTRNPGAVILEPRRALPTRVPASLTTDDIPGARPRSLPPRPRQEFYETRDVEGAQPRQLHREVRYAPADVEGSRPQHTKLRTKRATDPLLPAYGLPSVPLPAPVELPYRRDLALRNDDIAGSAPNAHLPWATRAEHTSVADIAGTAPSARTREARHEHVDANLHVRDINAFRTFRSQRRSDPQRPAFAVHGRVVRDEDPGMFVAPPRPAAQHPDFSLTTADIDGATACDAKEPMVGGIKPENRRDYRVTNFVADIAGTSPGSKKRGLATLRGTDPLERDYVMLDGRGLDASELAVGKSWYGAATAILAAEAAAENATMLIGRSKLQDGVAPFVDYSKRIVDPRDAELARLRGAAATLARERDVLALSAQLKESARSAREGAELIATGVLVPGAAGSSGAGAGSGGVGAAAAYESGSGGGGGGGGGSGAEEGSSGAAPPHVPALDLPPQPPALGDTAASLSATLGGSARKQVTGRGWHRATGVGGLRGSNEPTPYARTLRGEDSGETAGGAGPGEGLHDARSAPPPPSLRAPVTDPVASLRSTAAPHGMAAAAASARNVLGVVPATRPPQNLSTTATLREASHRFDAALDGAPAARRPGATLAQAAQRASQGAAATAVFKGGVSYVVRAAREEARSRAAEVAEVRALPSFK